MLSTVIFVALLACMSLITPECGRAAETQRPDGLEEAVHLALELLEADPVDATAVFKNSKPCCVRGKFEINFMDTAEQATTTLGDTVNAYDVLDELLKKIRRRHWTVEGNLTDGALVAYEALKEKTKDMGYFDN